MFRSLFPVLLILGCSASAERSNQTSPDTIAVEGTRVETKIRQKRMAALGQDRPRQDSNLQPPDSNDVGAIEVWCAIHCATRAKQTIAFEI